MPQGFGPPFLEDIFLKFQLTGKKIHFLDFCYIRCGELTRKRSTLLLFNELPWQGMQRGKGSLSENFLPAHE